MHGDFSRDSFDASQNFVRILLQQGRLIADADLNEQSSILLNYLRNLAADLVGWHGGPDVFPAYNAVYPAAGAADQPRGAFRVRLDTTQVRVFVTGGRYYINGWLLNWPEPKGNDQYEAFSINAASELANRVVYVDLRLREVPAFAGSPLLDPGLGGLDTVLRTRLDARFAILHTDLAAAANVPTTDAEFRKLPVKRSPADTAPPPLDSRPPKAAALLPQLRAWTNQTTQEAGSCDDEPAGAFTGLENQLYRVEIHRGGTLFWNGQRDAEPSGPPKLDKNQPLPVTVKWSRDNGSIVYPVRTLSAGSTNQLVLAAGWRDASRAIEAGNWIEILAVREDSGLLVRVDSVDQGNDGITILFKLPEGATGNAALLAELAEGTRGPVIARRWDHKDRKDYPLSEGAILLREQPPTGAGGAGGALTPRVSVPIPLEDGLVVRLELPVVDNEQHEFRAGDYWLIPARTSTGDILWPIADPKATGEKRAAQQPARYEPHYYAPVAFLLKGAVDTQIFDLRRRLRPGTEPAAP